MSALMILAARVALVLLLVHLPQWAWGASLRPLTTLTTQVVRLSDLFDDAGARSGETLGPAPALGGRIIVEAAQLDAIARQYGVAWRSGSPADRAVLDRPGQLLPREAVMGPLREALVEAGVPDTAEVELPGFEPPLVAETASARPAVTNMSYDPETGRFTGILSITGPGMQPVNMRLAGRAIETADIVVPNHRIQPGDIVQASDLRHARVRARLLLTPVARTPDQAVGLTVRHVMASGQPLALADLTHPLAVAKGDMVMLLLESPGLALTAQGRALDSGALGDRVRVANPGSRALVEGEVVAAGRVRVTPGAAPIDPSGRVALR